MSATGCFSFTQSLVDLGALPDDADLDIRRQAHYAKHRRLIKIRLHLLWTGLHAAVAIFGTVLAVVILTR